MGEREKKEKEYRSGDRKVRLMERERESRDYKGRKTKPVFKILIIMEEESTKGQWRDLRKEDRRVVYHI